MMRAIAGLMRLAGIEGDALIDPRVPIPITTSIDFARPVPIERIACIEHGDAIGEISDWSEAGERFIRSRARVSRNAI